MDEKKKRLHYERIRIQEDRAEIAQQNEECDKIEQEIDSKVYEDTKDQQSEKCRIGAQIDDLDQEIAALEA